MRVLLVEDDTSTAKSIELMLKSEGYIVDLTDLGEDGVEIGKIYDYDIIILDLMLPDMDGYDVLKELRDAKVETPILILSGLTELDNKIKGLGYGADDYLTKPFDKRELVARIQAIVRRRTLTKEMFLNHLYGGMDEPEVKIIDVFICKLRKKIQDATGGDNYIETVWGRGYVLRDPRETTDEKKAG